MSRRNKKTSVTTFTVELGFGVIVKKMCHHLSVINVDPGWIEDDISEKLELVVN